MVLDVLLAPKQLYNPAAACQQQSIRLTPSLRHICHSEACVSEGVSASKQFLIEQEKMLAMLHLEATQPGDRLQTKLLQFLLQLLTCLQPCFLVR